MNFSQNTKSIANYIFIVDNGIRQLVPVENILHVKAIRIYSIIHIRGGQKEYISTRNIGQIYQQLDPLLFLRVHKSHIINLHEIKSIQFTRGGKITLSDNTVVNVAQRRKTEVLWHLQKLNTKNVRVD